MSELPIPAEAIEAAANAHLEAVTNRENVMRGVLPTRARKHCPKGHPYDAENTYRSPRDNKRSCRACRRESARRYRNRVSRWLPVEQDP